MRVNRSPSLVIMGMLLALPLGVAGCQTTQKAEPAALTGQVSPDSGERTGQRKLVSRPNIKGQHVHRPTRGH